MVKRNLAIMLSVVMASAVLTSCGKENGSGGGGEKRRKKTAQ